MNTHHTLSRRDFMKALGIGAAGVGAATAVTPLFKDLDEMMNSGEDSVKITKRAWYVRERELGNPTTEVDWTAIVGHENNYIMNSESGASYGFGAQAWADLKAQGAANMRAAAEAKAPAWKVQDFALGWASEPVTSEFIWHLNETMGPSYTRQPGLAKYSGTPEQNSHMIRAAVTHLGAQGVGFCVLQGDEKKLFNKVHSEGRPFVWENLGSTRPYDTPEKIVCPADKELYAIALSLPMSKEMFRHEYNVDGGYVGPGQLRVAANIDRYRRWQMVYRGIQKFLNYLGYLAFGYPGSPWRGVIPAGADAILSGLAEGGRNSNVFVSPEFGTVNGLFSVITDLPLAPTAPIDAGIRRFCHTCKKCAESCPAEAISFDNEPVWVHDDPTLYKFNKEKPVKFCSPGKKNFVTDSYACEHNAAAASGWIGGNCANCMGTCTFNVNNGMGIHGMVKGMLSTTGLFNGFLWRADAFYGFGLTPNEKKEEWWDMYLPASGIDSTILASDGTYKQRGSAV